MIDHPRTYSTKAIMIERIHTVQTTKPIFDSIRINTFPNGRSTLLNRIQPRRIGSLKQQTIGQIRTTHIRKYSINPGCSDKTGQQRIGLKFFSTINHRPTSDGFLKMLHQYLGITIVNYMERQRQHVGSLYIHKLT